MPTSTEVAGISIGIQADVGGLDASLRTASNKVDNWARRTENRRVNVTVNAVKGDSWKTIEREFEALIARVTQGQKVPVQVDFDVNPRQLHQLYENLYNTIRTQVGTRKIPLDIDYKAKVDVAVSWHWTDGPPPGDLSVGVSGGGGGGTGGGASTTQGRRRSVNTTGETVTPSPTQAPAGENFGQRMARLRQERAAAQTPASFVRTQTGTTTARPTTTVAPTRATVEEVSGIAAMGTGTPRTRAQRETEKVIRENTAAHRAQTQTTREWIKVSAARAREVAGPGASFRRGASGFTAEMVEGVPTGQVKYRAGGQPFHFIPEGRRPSPARGDRQKFAPVPEHQQPQARAATTEDQLIADILAVVSPEQGAALTGLGVVPTSLPAATRKKLQSRINNAIVGKMQGQERRASRTPTGVDWRSARWFDSGSDVDPAQRQMMQEAFIEEQIKTEDAEWDRLKEVFGATDEQRETILKNWAGKSERWGKLVSTFGEKGIKNLAATLGGVLAFSAKESDKTIADAAKMVEQGEYTEAYDILRPVMQQARREVLSQARSPAVGAQRLARLRGEATKGGKSVLPRTEAETAYMAGAALQGRIRIGQEFARQDDRRAAGVEKAKETRAGKRDAAARAAYIEQYGPAPEPFKGEKFISSEEHWRAAAREGGFDDAETAPIPPTPEYEEYLGQVKDFWADFRDFAEQYEPPKAESKAKSSGKLAIRKAADVGLSERNKETQEMARRLGEAQMAEEEGLDFDPDEMANLVHELERRALRGSGLRERIEKGPASQRPPEQPPEKKPEPFVPVWRRRDQTSVRTPRMVGSRPAERQSSMGMDLDFGPGNDALTEAWRLIEARQPGSFEQFLAGFLERRVAAKGTHHTPESLERIYGPMRGSSPESLEGLPVEVPDVRDISEALGIGRGGFQAGRPRRVVAAGVLEKLRRQTKGADVEKAAYLVGESYVDEFGRQLDVITEAVMAEAEATSKGFRTTPAAAERLTRRLRANRRSRTLGSYHGIEGHGLRLSTPGNAAVPEQNDTDFLLRQAQEDPNYLSMVGDPAAGGFAAFGAAGGQVGRRSFNVVRNPQGILRSAVRPVTQVNPVQAGAEQIDLRGMTRDLVDAWESATDDMRSRWVDTFATNQLPMPDVMQQWANARATAAQPDEFDPIAHWDAAIGGATGTNAPLPVRWAMGAAGAGMQPGIQPGPSVGQVAARAAMMGVNPGGPGIPAGAGGGFGFGGGGRGPINLGGGGPAQPAGNSGLNRGQFNRSFEAIRQDLLRTDVPQKKIEGIEDQYELDFESTLSFITEQRTELQNALAATPVRALSTAVGQFVAQRVARGPAQAAQRRAQLLIRQQERAAKDQLQAGLKAEGTLELLRQERATGISQATGQAFTPEDEKNRQRELASFRRTRNVARAEVQGLQPRIESAVKEAAPLSRQLLNLAALTPAIVAGGVIFQAAMAAAQAGLDALGKVAMEGAEAGTGFNQTMRRVQDELAQAALERGDVRGVVAQRFSQAGFEATPEQRALLEGRTQAVTATNRFIEQRDLLRSLEGIHSNAPGAARFGIDTALVRPTGGFMGTAIGAQQSLDEIIGNELERLNPSGAAGMFNILNERAPFTGDLFGNNFQLFGQTQAGIDRERAQQDFAANLNRELGSVGNRSRFEVGDLGFGTPQRSQQAAALDLLGANEIAAAVRAGAYEIRGANGEIVTSQEELAGIIKDLGDALSMPSGAEFRRANERVMESALIGIQDQFRNVQTDAGIGFYRNFAVNRPLPFGTGFNSGDADSQAAMAAFGPAAREARSRIGMRAMQGRSDAINLGVDPEDLDRLEQYGQEIANIRTDLASRQLELSGKAYNQQLTVAKRTLSDILGLTGKTAAQGASAVGLAERENLMLERRNTVLGREIQARGLEMNQRQINFNLAVAGFTAGGATPAEAAARMEQARLEAQFAQADQNARVEMFGNEGRMVENTIAVVDEQNLRSLQDAIFAVNQIEESHALEKYAAAAEQYMDLVAAERQGLEAEVDAQIARGTAVRDLGLESARKEFEATGEYLLDVTEDIGAAFRAIQEDYEKWLDDLELPGVNNEPGVSQRESEANRDYSQATRNAAGALFNTAGEQHMIVGEAGTETVAVLRNPRMANFGSGSGSNVQININNPTVRNDSDITAIARAVEEALRQRAVLVRPR